MSAASLFKNRGKKALRILSKDCMKIFLNENIFESLRKHVMKIVNFEKNKNEFINKTAAGII